jgi:hypothetical protein
MRPEKLKVVQIFDFKYAYYTSFTVCISLIALQLFLGVSTAIFTSSICLCKSTPAPQLLSILEEYISATGLALRRGTSKSFAHGNGAIASVMKTNSAVAQSYPSFSYTMQKHQHLHFIASPFLFILLTLNPEKWKRGTESTPREAVGCKCAGCIKWICIDEERPRSGE